MPLVVNITSYKRLNLKTRQILFKNMFLRHCLYDFLADMKLRLQDSKIKIADISPKLFPLRKNPFITKMPRIFGFENSYMHYFDLHMSQYVYRF
jgi:hypothetical protein